jgi:hypothetical protein
MPRRRRANHGKHGTFKRIRRTQRIAIHGRDIRRWLREPRQNGPRQHTPGRFWQGHGFGGGWRQRGQDACARILNRQQAALFSHW